MLEYLVTYSFAAKAQRDAFYAEILANKIGEQSEAEDGCLRYEYFMPTKNDTSLFLVEIWRDAAAQQHHKTMPHFALLGPLKEKYGCASKFEIFNCEEAR